MWVSCKAPGAVTWTYGKWGPLHRCGQPCTHELAWKHTERQQEEALGSRPCPCGRPNGHVCTECTWTFVIHPKGYRVTTSHSMGPGWALSVTLTEQGVWEGV